MAKRAAFLDRDGVLNRAIMKNGVPCPPATLSELQILPGVIEACQLLRAAGFALIVVTNQPDVARGLQKIETIHALNRALLRAISFDDLLMCLHDDKDGCGCRKPKPGMLLEAADRHSIDLSASVMVGDRDRDIAAGQAAGCRTVFIEHGYARPPQPVADLTVKSLREAVDWMISVGVDAGAQAP